jgi:hypothetical protein
MRNYPRRGSRLPLECSCETRITDWALTPWGDRLYAVQVIAKGDRCRVKRHRVGVTLSVRPRTAGGYYDTRR